MAALLFLSLGWGSIAQAGGFSVVPVGHSHHAHGGYHNVHYGHGYGGYHYGNYAPSRLRYGNYYGYSRFGYAPSSFGLQLNFGRLGVGYRNYTPYRTYYVAPSCYGSIYYPAVPSCYQSNYYGSPYDIYYHSGTSSSYYTRPLTQPAEAAYGPQAVKRFMGVDPNFALGDLVRDDPKLVLGAPVTASIAPKVRETNWDAHRRAYTFMDRGDTAFAQGQYAAALADYDKAIQNAPDLPETHLRQAFGLMASGRYSAATSAIGRAISVDPKVTTDIRFELTDLYNGNAQAKQAHFEAIAKAALAAPNDSELLILLGAALHYDRQVLRAEKFFQRAADMGGEAAPLAEKFLPALGGAI